jgi:hypothetical protein
LSPAGASYKPLHSVCASAWKIPLSGVKLQGDAAV